MPKRKQSDGIDASNEAGKKRTRSSSRIRGESADDKNCTATVVNDNSKDKTKTNDKTKSSEKPIKIAP